MKNKFFDQNGFFVRFMEGFANLVILNLLTLLCCVPIVTSGAALAALHYMVMQIVNNEDGKIASTYFRQFKANLRNATPIALIYIALTALVVFELRMANYMNSLGAVVTACIFGFIFILLAVFVWIIPLTAKFVYNTAGAFRNALFLAFSKLPRTVAMIIITVILPVLIVNFPELWPIGVMLGVSLPVFLCVLIYNPVFKELIEQKEGNSQDLNDNEEQ
ncbi:MAG: YesL family protein [Candidatus Weimeria sp.]